MDAIRRGILRAADQMTLAGLHAGKFFGFLGSGRDLVQMDHEPSGPMVRFRDLADEGWPAFSVPLPSGAAFRYAAAGPLSRIALWQVARPERRVLRELENRREEIRLSSTPDGVFEAKLPDNVTLRVRGHEPEMSFLIIKQAREADAIGNVIRARAASWHGGS